MGCHQSVPKRTERGLESRFEHAADSSSNNLPTAVHELEANDFVQVPAQTVEVELTAQSEPEFHEVADSEAPDYVSNSFTVDSRLVSSAVAENAHSQVEDSSDSSERPISPDLIVSPNPMSPANGPRDPAPKESTRQVDDLATRLGLITPNQTGFITPTETSLVASPRDHKSAFATPVSLPPVPESSQPTPFASARKDSNRSMSSTGFRSRLSEVADLRNDKLCLQVFTFWRSEVLKGRVDILAERLDATAKASQLILNENTKLKARVVELENAIAVVNSIEKKTVATDSSDLDPIPTSVFVPAKTTIPPSPDTQSSFASVPSRMTSVSGVPSGFITPQSAYLSPSVRPVNISSDQENHRRNWEDYLRPSSELSSGFPEIGGNLIPGASQMSSTITPTTLTPNIMSVQPPALSKDKLKAISEDLQKLSDSLSVMNKRMGS